MNDNSEQLFNLISNIQAKLNDNSNNDSNNSTYNIQDSKVKTSDNTDYSGKQDQDNFSASNNQNSANNFDFSNIDMNTILKMQSLFSKFNKSSPKKNLLYSLKPFLNKTRQDSLGEYITILSLMDAFDLFSKKGSDSNV